MKQGIISKKENGKVIVRLANEYYERQAVSAAAHKLTDRFVVVIDPIDDRAVGVYLEPKGDANLNEQSIDDAISAFCNDILDEQVRLDLDRQYGSLRDLIVRQAFTPLTSSELSNEVKGLKK